MDAITGLSSVASISIAGMIATLAMSLFVLSFSRTVILPLNPLVAVGTMVTRSRSEALKAGMLIHVCLGLGAAFFYAALLKAAGFVTGMTPIAAASLIGLIHGYILSFLIVISLGENGQTPGVRKQGMTQAGVYLFAHVLFGLTLGIMFAALPASLHQ